ncbi:hypothetical protein JXI42_00050 [bacterium]|nr:hypothetical protein [bacterium]
MRSKALLFILLFLIVLMNAARADDLDLLLKDFSGICCVINPQNGQELFYYNSLPDSELCFPIGSTIKVFTSIAAHRQGVLDPEEIFVCAPTSIDSPITKRCWYTPGHGTQSYVEALGNSCNAYFLNLAEKVDFKMFLETLQDYKLIDNNYKPCQNNRESQVRAMVGIDNSIRVSLKSLLLAYGSLFNGGVLYSGSGEKAAAFSLDTELLKSICEGMEYSAYSGTSIEAQKRVMLSRILAKTGTAPYYLDDKYDPVKTRALFLGFAPVEKPLLAVLVFALEGTGAKEGAIKGGEILEYFIRKYR